MSIEILFAVIGLILFAVYFFVPNPRIAAAAGVALGLALVSAWAIPG